MRPLARYSNNQVASDPTILDSPLNPSGDLSISPESTSNVTSQMMEDFNLPSAERTILLRCLHEAMGDVPTYFWAICQVCDLQALQKLVELAQMFPAASYTIALEVYTIVLYCK